jgi:putative transposase
VFGRKALIQRCRQHKERNILDHLPEAERPLVQRRLRAAWVLTDADQATAELEQLARSLDRQRPGAAASLREGLAETLTVTRLGVGGKLLQTVESTNPVESMIEIIRDHAGRVKRWSSGEMALRWAAAGMLAAQGQFRRVKGYQELPQLALALERATTQELGMLDLPAAVSTCQHLSVGSVMEAPPKSNGARDILQPKVAGAGLIAMVGNRSSHGPPSHGRRGPGR